MENISQALVVDSAASKVGNDLALTQQQESLGLKLSIVYMAGLVLHNKPSSLCTQFQQLQAFYNETSENADTQLFQYLSPRMIPSKEQQKIIDRDIATKLDEMEKEANAAAEELIQNEMTCNKSKKSKTRKKKKARKRFSTDRSESDTQTMVESNIPLHHEETETSISQSESPENNVDESQIHNEGGAEKVKIV